MADLQQISEGNKQQNKKHERPFYAFCKFLKPMKCDEKNRLIVILPIQYRFCTLNSFLLYDGDPYNMCFDTL